MAGTPTNAIVLVSGKRFSGKDHLVGVAKGVFGGVHREACGPRVESVFASTTDLFKEDFTLKFRDEIDHDRLLTDREYKEQHRMMMTAYWTEIKALDQTRYCSRLLEQARQMFRQRAADRASDGVAQVRLFFVTGIRYSWEIEYFEQALHSAADGVRLVRLRVQSPLEFKKQLGWHESPIDSHETEIGLDSFDRWDLVFTNDKLGDEHTTCFLRNRLLSFIGSTTSP